MNAYKVNEHGFIVEIYNVVKIDANIITIEYEIGKFKEVPVSDYVIDVIQNSLHKPQWNGASWAEGKTEEEFLEDAFLASLNPSAQELTKAERDLETIELLIEMGLI